MRGPSIYVASPLGFSEPGSRYLTERLHPALAARGLAVLDPWSSGEALLETLAGAPPEEQNERLGAANAALIVEADAVLAVLDGSDVDSGTASEIGFASGIGKPVVGLRTDFRMAGDNPAAAVNLQVLHFLTRSGGGFTRRLDEALDLIASLVPAPERDAVVFHLTGRSLWETARAAGSYAHSTRDQLLEEVGFIHCSTADQLLASANRFYADVDPSELVVLVIDPEQVTVPLVFEPASNGEEFPHLHGPLNCEAVVATVALGRSSAGFELGPAGPA